MFFKLASIPTLPMHAFVFSCRRLCSPRCAVAAILPLMVLWIGATGRAQTVTAATRFEVTGDWGAGANATLWITNTGSTTITNNLLGFDFDRSITPYNNLRIASHTGNHYGLTNESYYPTIVPPGTSFHFDMQVNPGGLNGAQPTNYTINGVPLAGYVPPVTLAIADASVTAGGSGTSPMSFPVILTYPATNIVTVHFATVDGTAVAGQDYLAASGDISFAVGTTQQVIQVSVVGSSSPKPELFFNVQLSNVSNATFSRSAAVGTIRPYQTLVVTTYPDWRANNNVPAGVGDGDDADADGFNTVSEYVLALNPLLADASNSPLSQRVENGLLKLTYPRYRPDIAYRVMTSDDLLSWTTNGIAEIASGYLVTASVAAPGIPSRYLSLRVTPLAHAARFLQHYADLHNPANGYFSTNGIPYHSPETLLCEAPDYGHETTSEAWSYYLLIEAMYGRLTGDWSRLAAAWTNMETYMIPTHADQPSNDNYTQSKPATYAPEWELPSLYPAQINSAAPVGADPLYAELKSTYGTSDLYGMHWIMDVDNWYGFGQRGDGTTRPSFINTFQRGKQESVWETIPQPCWDVFRWGGPNGYLDLFTGDSTYTRQWKYTTAPDADARAIQAIYWAKSWADAQGGSSVVNGLAAKASRMGDCLRYSLFDKYFRNVTNSSQAGSGRQACHYLISWYYAWGGSTNNAGGWSWRIGCSHSHFGYQNPMAAWALGNAPGFIPASPTARQDWTNSLRRQLEFYRWLQSDEGAIAGGATSSWNGRYETPPAGTSTFYGMAYLESPVYEDPPSTRWFGMQTWSMERVAEYYYLSNDPLAKQVLDKWVAWVLPNIQLPDDGSFAIPGDLAWSGQPDAWNPSAPGANTGLHVTISNWGQDLGITASLARTLLYYSAGTKRWAVQDTASKAAAQALLDRLWMLNRDALGVSAPEHRQDYTRFFEQTVYTPPGWIGHMPNGDTITNNVTFLGLRSKYLQDPAFPALTNAYSAWVAGGKSGDFQSPEYRYHRFWAQAEVALANATFDMLFPGE
ncbi:MAG: glycoside hydrolase family 48 protein [Verrucomicrobiota bacterium]